jgi:hypothetical protein
LFDHTPRFSETANVETCTHCSCRRAFGSAARRSHQPLQLYRHELRPGQGHHRCATIAADGAAIMRYRSKRNPGLPLYGRYDDDGRFSEADEYARTVFIPARDMAQCPVHECWHFDIDDRDEPFRHRR